MAIFDIHHPWAFAFGVIGNIISIFVYLAPMPTFIRIFKEKTTMGFDSLPYAVALFSAMLWMYYAVLKTNAILLISINSFGCIIETVYLVLYIFYASKKAKSRAAKLFGLMNVGLLSVIFLVTFFIFQGAIRIQVVGWICVAVSVCVFAAPLSIVYQVVRTRSVEFMPFPLSFFLTLSAVAWFAYGLFQKDICVALPNVIGFFLGFLQMLLYGIFRNMKQAGGEIEKVKKIPEQVLNVMVIGSPEVHQSHNKSSTDDGDQIGTTDHITASVVEENVINIETDDDDGDGLRRCVVPCALSVEPTTLHLEPPVLVLCAA